MASADTSRATRTRRGILAAAGVAVAGMIAKQAAEPVAAYAGESNGGHLVLGANDYFGPTPLGKNTETHITQLANTAGPISLGPIISDSAGLLVTGSDNSMGVIGQCSGPTGWGIYGISDKGIGVYGSVGGVGASGGYGVSGDTLNPNSFGVYGYATGANSIGVFGNSGNGTGVVGSTNASNQYGVLGQTFAANSTAIAGACAGNGSSAFSGGTTNPNAYAGVFQGTVVVQGRLVVSDPSYKSGVLQHPDGSHRLVYCMESPESWIEDFGEAAFTNGAAEIKLAPDFTAVVHMDTYHVFLTEYDDHHALYVTERRADGFEVRAKGAVGSGRCSWRVVAKPKSTVKQERLAAFPMPHISIPAPTHPPEPPTRTPRP